MKKLMIVLLLLFIIGCTPQEEPTQDIMDHIGCQEDEIDKDGICILAEENNAGLFNQELDVYTEDNQFGYLAKPKSAGKYPGVLMIHEWWGLNDNVKEMARILANEGYIVLAVDLYGEVAEDSTKARELATKVRTNPEKAIQDMKAAVQYLESDSEKVASLGWCFGGQHSLLISLNDKLDATVIYYGQLVDDKDQIKDINWPVLGIFGEKDTSISVESVRSFESALNDLGIENEIYIYEGVGHAFANPSGSNYAPEETLNAWEKTIAFLEKHLKSESITGPVQAPAADPRITVEELSKHNIDSDCWIVYEGKVYDYSSAPRHPSMDKTFFRHCGQTSGFEEGARSQHSRSSEERVANFGDYVGVLDVT